MKRLGGISTAIALLILGASFADVVLAIPLQADESTRASTCVGTSLEPSPQGFIVPNVELAKTATSQFRWFNKKPLLVYQNNGWKVVGAPGFVPMSLQADGQQNYQLTPYSVPLPSPDDSQIAFGAIRRSDGIESLWAITRNEKETVDLLPGDLARSRPSAKRALQWKDKKSFRYSIHVGTGSAELWQLDLRPNKPKILIGDAEAEFSLGGASYDLAPQNNKVVIANGGDYSLTRLNLVTGQTVNLKNPLGLEEFQDWSANSSKVLFSEWKGFFPVERKKPSLYLWDESLEKSELILQNAGEASWAPAGDLIAFVSLGVPRINSSGQVTAAATESGDPPKLNLVVLRMSDRKPVVIVPLGQALPNFFGSTAFRPIWSPDGSMLIYRDTNNILWAIKLGCASRTRIYPASESAQIIWSPDGQWLAIGMKEKIQIYSRASLGLGR